MVENFTPKNDQTYTNEIEQITVKNEDTFEAIIKDKIQYLATEPSQSLIDNILQYSKSLSKK